MDNTYFCLDIDAEICFVFKIAADIDVKRPLRALEICFKISDKRVNRRAYDTVFDSGISRVASAADNGCT